MEHLRCSSLPEALTLLKARGVLWSTTNRIENSLVDTGVAFYGSNYCVVGYHDEVNEVLTLFN